MAQLCSRKNGKKISLEEEVEETEKERPLAVKEVGEDEIASKHNCFLKNICNQKNIVHFLTPSTNTAVAVYYHDAVRYTLSLTGRKKRACQRLRWLDPVLSSAYLSPSDLLYVNSLVFVFVLLSLFS